MKNEERPPLESTRSRLEVPDNSRRREDSGGSRLKRRQFCNRLLLTSLALLYVGD